MSSLFVGHETFLSSARTSLTNWKIPFFSPFCSDNALTLPKLFGFFVKGVLLAEFAILFQLDAVGSIFLVLVRPVVAIFAIGAGQGNIRPHDSPSCCLIE